jgi:hypothetical protein
MKLLTACLLSLLLAVAATSIPAAGAPVSLDPTRNLAQWYGNLPISFTPNEGQSDPQVRFLARGRGYNLFLTTNEAALALRTAPASLAPNSEAAPSVLRMALVGANPSARVQGADPLEGRFNFFVGNDPARWRTNVPSFSKVRYYDVYAGIDLVYYGNQGRLEYDFIVAPGASPSAIALRFRGAQPRLTSSGNLLLRIADSDVEFDKPVVYQTDREHSGGKHFLPGRFKIMADGRIGFDVPHYDRRKPLVIDPALTYSTYLGGSDTDGGFAVAVDSTGNAYLTGGTLSTAFPTTTGAFQTTFGGQKTGCHGVPSFVCGDAFVTKLNSTGTALVYSTYLGGNDRDSGNGLFVDSSGNVYVAGETQSTNFPVTAGVVQPTLAGARNAFVTKLNSSGSALLYSTYLGGSQKDGAFAITVNSSGNAYITGATRSSNFPVTAGAFQTACGSCTSIPDAFVAELNSGATALVYSTYLGGNGQDAGTSLAIDSSGNAYVTGTTVSTNFPTQSPLQASFGGGGTDCPVINSQIDSHIFVCGDAFVTKLNSSGTALVYSTYLGGTGDDTGFGIAVDPVGNAYVGGGTASTNYPTTGGAAQTAFGGGNTNCSSTGIACGDGFLTKLNSAGSAIIYSTFLGGTADDVIGRIALDSSLNVHYSGITQSSNFPVTADAAQFTFGGGTTSCANGAYCGDVVMGILNLNGSGQVYASYLGGSGDEGAFGTALDSSGNTYVTGATLSTNFPTSSGAYDTTCGTDGNCNGGLSDAFVAKVTAPLPIVTFSPTSLSYGDTLIGSPSSTKKTTLTNGGSGTLVIGAITTTGDYAQTNTCPVAPSALAAGASCTISVTFTPTVPSTINGELTVVDSAANAVQLVGLSGVGHYPLTGKPTSLAFGTVTVGTTSSPQTLTLTNNQKTSLTIGFSASTNYTAVGSGTTPCGTTLAGKATCTMSVTFSPTSNGLINGAVTLNTSAAPLTEMIRLTGTGAGGGTAPLTFSPASLSFNNQLVGTTSKAKTVTVTNSSTGSITINSLSAPGEYSAFGSGTTPCPTTLAAGKTCTFSVTYNPDETGNFIVGIGIADSSTVSPQVYKASGTGVLPLTFSPASLTFATQSVGTVSAAQTVTMTNNQSTTVTLNGITASGDYTAVAGGSTPCGGSIAAGKTCTFNVTFSPTLAGTIAGDVTVSSNAFGSAQVIAVTGKGQ